MASNRTPGSSITIVSGIAVTGAGSGLQVDGSNNVSVTWGTTSGTSCQGNDSRLSDTRTPTDGSVTDAKIASGGLATASLNWAAIASWAPSTSYAKGDLVDYQGIAYRRSSAGTSGTSFSVANWQQTTPTPPPHPYLFGGM